MGPIRNKIRQRSIVRTGAVPLGVLSKNERETVCVFFAAAQDLTAGFVIANGKSGPVAELFVLTEANK